MFWRTILVTLFAVGALGYTVNQKQRIKEKYRPLCEQTGNLDKLDDLATAIDGSVKCLEDTINMETLPSEIRNAMINGGLKDVFKSQCAKASQLKACSLTIKDGISLCMNVEMREFLAATNTSEELIDFACFNDGERISKFIVDDGPLCFQEKSSGLKKCVEGTEQSGFSMQDRSNLNPTDYCAVLNNLTSCVSKELRTCSTTAAADLMESIVQLIKRSSPCK